MAWKGLLGQLVHLLLIQAYCWQYFHIHECFVQAANSITRASICSQERSFHLFVMSWLYGFFFFPKVLFLFSLTNQAMKIGFPGPNFTVLFFFFFLLSLRMGKSFQSREYHFPLVLTITKPWLQKHLIHPLQCNLSRSQKYSVTWKRFLFWRIRNNGLFPQ